MLSQRVKLRVVASQLWQHVFEVIWHVKEDVVNVRVSNGLVPIVINLFVGPNVYMEHVLLQMFVTVILIGQVLAVIFLDAHPAASQVKEFA